MYVLVGLLVVIALFFAAGGFVQSMAGSSGLPEIAAACLFVLLARLAQATGHQMELKDLIRSRFAPLPKRDSAPSPAGIPQDSPEVPGKVALCQNCGTRLPWKLRICPECGHDTMK